MDLTNPKHLISLQANPQHWFKIQVFLFCLHCKYIYIYTLNSHDDLTFQIKTRFRNLGQGIHNLSRWGKMAWHGSNPLHSKSFRSQDEVSPPNSLNASWCEAFSMERNIAKDAQSGSSFFCSCSASTWASGGGRAGFHAGHIYFYTGYIYTCLDACVRIQI